MKVLVVDDDPTSRLIAQMSVRDLGHECNTATDGLEAWDAFRSNPPDVVISDWLMPGLNGLQLCGKIRAHPEGGYTYFILVTRQDSRDKVAEGMEAGADDYLIKPLNPDDLRARLIAAARITRLFDRIEASGAALALANTELGRRNTQIEEAAAAQHRFISAASHELRNPLTSILGYLDMIANADSDADRAHNLEVVGRNATRLYGLVDSLMLVFRSEVETYAKDEVDLLRVATESLEAAIPAASSRGLSLELQASSPAIVLGDRERLGQAFDNLVSNAIKFSTEGGSIEIVLHSDSSKHKVSVTDHGIGIPASEVDKLFERFFRASTAREAQVEGTGLGLAITRAIIERHGGLITASSVAGAGTTFLLEFPVAVNSSPEPISLDPVGS